MAKYGALPVSDVAYRGFDSVNLICEALRHAKNVNDPDSIRAAFIAIKGFPGIAGSYDFTDASGDGLTTCRTYAIQDKKHVLYDVWKKTAKK